MSCVLRRLRRRLAADQRGQAIVELALTLPLLALLLMGALDFSVAVVRSTQLTSAVQEGVSFARQVPTDIVNIRDHVRKEGSGLTVADGDIVVTCFQGLTTTTKACSAAGIGDSVRVQATYRYQPLTGRLVALVGSTLNITQTATSEIY